MERICGCERNGKMIKYVGKLWEKEKERQMELIDGIVD